MQVAYLCYVKREVLDWSRLDRSRCGAAKGLPSAGRRRSRSRSRLVRRASYAQVRTAPSGAYR